MELTELQNIWQEYDKKISENTRLNKEILRLILLEKPQKKTKLDKNQSRIMDIFSGSVCLFNTDSGCSV